MDAEMHRRLEAKRAELRARVFGNLHDDPAHPASPLPVVGGGEGRATGRQPGDAAPAERDAPDAPPAADLSPGGTGARPAATTDADWQAAEDRTRELLVATAPIDLSQPGPEPQPQPQPEAAEGPGPGDGGAIAPVTPSAPPGADPSRDHNDFLAHLMRHHH